MNLNKLSYIVGSLLLGFSAVVLFQRSETAQRSRRRRAREQPVEELAATLKQAWAGYHTP